MLRSFSYKNPFYLIECFIKFFLQYSFFFVVSTECSLIYFISTKYYILFFLKIQFTIFEPFSLKCSKVTIFIKTIYLFRLKSSINNFSSIQNQQISYADFAPSVEIELFHCFKLITYFRTHTSVKWKVFVMF